MYHPKFIFRVVKIYSKKRLCSTVSDKTQHICIVGAGPAGFYAAMHLTKNLSNVNVDIIEKLPVPFGLIRYGVAPDHPEVKNVINQFSKVAQQPNVNFYGNISLGKDVSLAQLRQNYHAVLLTYGADEDKLLGIENENCKNVLAARKFVGWYNGLPAENDFEIDLSGSDAAVLGQGNVALDVARILLSPIDELRKCDIPEHVLSILAQSKLKNLYLVGRRGPLQVAFTIKELREQLKLKKCRTIWRETDFEGVSDVVKDLQRPRKRLTELMLKSLNENKILENTNDKDKSFLPIFHRSSDKFLVNNKNELIGIQFTCNKMVGDKLEERKCVPTELKEILNCTLAIRSIGYKSVKADSDLTLGPDGSIANDKGRVTEKSIGDLAPLYVAGWLGTGPLGVILHTMGNAFQVAKTICEDLYASQYQKTKGGFQEISKIIRNQTHVVDWKGWENIDKYEVEQGKQLGKPREKICSIKKMLEVANSTSQSKLNNNSVRTDFSTEHIL